MIDIMTQELQARLMIVVHQLDRHIADECRRFRAPGFNAPSYWVCLRCKAERTEVGPLNPLAIGHAPACPWLIELMLNWDTDLVELYLASWYQRNPQSKRIIRSGI